MRSCGAPSYLVAGQNGCIDNVSNGIGNIVQNVNTLACECNTDLCNAAVLNVIKIGLIFTMAAVAILINL